MPTRRGRAGLAGAAVLISALGGARLGLGVFLEVDLCADLLERAADQARDVHLGDAHLLGDLRLGQAFEEAEMEDPPLSVVERAASRCEDGHVLRKRVARLLGAERLERVDGTLLVLASGSRERE